jgi:hypothetical protein
MLWWLVPAISSSALERSPQAIWCCSRTPFRAVPVAEPRSPTSRRVSEGEEQSTPLQDRRSGCDKAKDRETDKSSAKHMPRLHAPFASRSCAHIREICWCKSDEILHQQMFAEPAVVVR